MALFLGQKYRAGYSQSRSSQEQIQYAHGFEDEDDTLATNRNTIVNGNAQDARGFVRSATAHTTTTATVATSDENSPNGDDDTYAYVYPHADGRNYDYDVTHVQEPEDDEDQLHALDKFKSIFRFDIADFASTVTHPTPCPGPSSLIIILTRQ